MNRNPLLGLGFVSGSPAGTVLPLGGAVLVGRDPEASLPLPPDEPGVSSRHARVEVRGHEAQVTDLGSRAGTLVDGAPIEAERPVGLPPGSCVRFGADGPLAVLGRLDDLRPAEGLRLRRADGGTWTLDRPLVVGRAEGVDVPCDPERDTVVSGRHAHVAPAFAGAVLTDLGSANGTFRDGRRVRQVFVPAGTGFVLGPDGPRFVVERPAPAEAWASLPTVAWESLRLDVTVGVHSARAFVLCRTRVDFGSFAGLNDIGLRCFPRELEGDADALERSESIGAQHGTLALTPEGIELIDHGAARTRLGGRVLEAYAQVALADAFEVELGDDVLGLRGRVFRHPRLQAAPPAVGQEGRHPVECLVLERKGDGADHLYVLLVRQASIGSDDGAAIRLDVPGVAPLHALLFLREGRPWLSQLGEAPVAVDGTPLSPGTALPLQPGSEVYLGTARLLVAETQPEDFDPA